MLTERPPARDVAHVALRLGRLMLANGADTVHVMEAVIEFARRLEYSAHLLVFSEGLLLTLEDGEGFHTRLGPTIAGTAVNMGALATLDEIRRREICAPSDIAKIDRELNQLEHSGNRYPHWLVVLGMGLTAASLARLFGAVWAVVGVSVLVGIATQLLRQRLGASSANPVAGAALAAFGGGLLGALVMKAFPGASPTLCLVAAGMILVPGVPLLNGVRDTLGNHVGTGIARLTMGTVTVLAIALGLFLAASVAGDTLPVGETLPLLPVGEDFLFSALAGGGYALLFNVPARAAWACVLCGMAGHGLRTALEHLGLELSVASLVGAFVATLVARLLAQRFRVPPVVFAFPGIVAMIPGSYAFRAGIGGLSIMNASSGASPALIGETIGLAVTATVVTAAIAIGLCLALAGHRRIKATGG
ncbi:threonine/serine exporter family protein [Mesorhizobium sp. YC-39]|uniref:threonine/serine ThrE exporter family protein n=1 Tax=unclassified Mesorhizobium TaxID=325217 RepID=UPI0021E913E2|nr:MULTISPECIES: threonine/serine exporter family protein [unclassified Mesorhizobium]MCV3210043.1 threonine/serine exporter family protein [Mesorhizobium sp. YC-2]MCV3230573.1 threonine/serine exporter family protein [Mesorhizobium sp. YC-39]